MSSGTTFGPHPGGGRRDQELARSYHLAQTRAAGNPAATTTSARWYANMLEFLGDDPADWPDVSRAAAEQIDPQERAAVEAARARGAGGAQPPSYAHNGHLRPQCVSDEAPDTYASRSSVEHERRMADPLDHLRSHEQRRPWRRREVEWLGELALRARVEAATGRKIVNGNSIRPEPCREAGQIEKHEHVTDAIRFRAYVCKQRSRCPHCQRAYGLEQADELRSLLEAAVARSGIPYPKLGDDPVRPIAWGMVVTMPQAVTEHLGTLADDPWSRIELREGMAKVVEVAREAAVRVVLGERADMPPRAPSLREVDPKGALSPAQRAAYRWTRERIDERRRRVRELRAQVGAAINLHWWSSRTPTNGWHWHAHVILPNVRKDGGTWRDVGTLSAARLELVKRRVADALREAWPELVPESYEAANVNVRWIANTQKGRKQLAHRCRYDARAPYSDLLKLSLGRRAELVYGGGSLDDVRRFAIRAERLQPLKLRRYVGWLVPGQRTKHDVVPEELEDDGSRAWVPLEDGYRTIVGFTDEGVRLRKRVRTIRGNLEVTETVAQGRDVRSMADRRGRQWKYRPAARDGPENGGATMNDRGKHAGGLAA